MVEETEEEWKSLNGCNACINSEVCAELGNCVLLSIDAKFPDYNKEKRKIIQRIRSIPNANRKIYVQDILRQEKLKEEPMLEFEPEYRTWEGTVRLTRLEQMFIDSLNKRRNYDNG